MTETLDSIRLRVAVRVEMFDLNLTSADASPGPFGVVLLACRRKRTCLARPPREIEDRSEAAVSMRVIIPARARQQSLDSR